MYGMLTDRYKSQPEVGHGGAAAALNPEGRKRASKHFFGHSGVEPSEYEKCGYLGLADDGEDWDDGSAEGYGGQSPVMYTFKKDRMKDRTTYTFGDSLNTEYRISSAGYGGTHPTIEGMTSLYSKRDVLRAVDYYKQYKRGDLTYSEFFKMAKSLGNNDYIELQYHGPVTAEDIEKITFKSTRGMEKAFEKMKPEQRTQVFAVLKNHSIPVLYRDGSTFKDAKDYLNQKYGAGL